MELHGKQFRALNIQVSLDNLSEAEFSIGIGISFRIIKSLGKKATIELTLVVEAQLGNDEKNQFIKIKTSKEFELFANSLSHKEEIEFLKRNAFPIIYTDTCNYINSLLTNGGANQISFPDFSSIQNSQD